MKNRKKYIMSFVCMLLTLVMAVSVFPVETKAATKIEITNKDLLEESEVWIYKGAKKLYFGDYIKVTVDGNYYELGYGYLTKNGGATFTSNKPSVAEIDKKTGKITAKKKGTATITTKYKGYTLKVKVRVVETKDEIIEHCSEEVQGLFPELEQRTKVFFQHVDARPKINNSNRYTILSTCNSDGFADIPSEDGCIGYEWYDGIYYIYSPEAMRAHIIAEQMDDYVDTMDPFFSSNKNGFRIKSVSGKGGSRKVTMKLNGKVTDDQMFGLKAHNGWDTEVRDSKTQSFPIEIKNMKNKHRYYAIATAKKGSDTITIDTRNLKLEKGITYQVFGPYGEMEKIAKSDTFKAK